MTQLLPAHRAFTAAEAVATGVSRHRLRHLVELGLLVQPARGWYARVDGVAVLARNAESRVSGRTQDLVAAHNTAAALHGLRTPTRDARMFFVCAREFAQPEYQTGLVVLPARIDEVDVAIMDGLRTTSLERTALDLARGCSLEFALVPIDHALALGAQPKELMASRRRMHGWPGTRILDTAIAVADAAAESALESMSRGALIAAGMPLPQLQVEVRGKSGRRYRADFLWREQRVIGEADGFGKYSTRGEQEKQTFRDEDLKAADWNVVHWTFEQMLVGDRPALRWLQGALRTRNTADPERTPQLHPPAPAEGCLTAGCAPDTPCRGAQPAVKRHVRGGQLGSASRKSARESK